MSQREEATQWRNALISAFHEGDEARARAQVTQLGARKAKPLLEAMLPETLVSTLPAFISSAEPLMDTAVSHKGAASAYCVDLFSLLLMNPERLLPMLPEAALDRLRDMARKWVTATSSLKCSLQAAVLLKHLGRKKDAALLEAHRPADPTLAKVFDDAARALRG